MQRLLACAFVLAMATIANAQTYDMWVTDLSVAEGGSGTSNVMLTFTGADDIAGWSYGVCHDDSQATIDDAVMGSTPAAFDGGGGPDFIQINLPPDVVGGYTVGVVISFLGAETLPAGSDYELSVATYTATGAPASTSDLRLCTNELGSPPVAVVVVVNGASVTPSLTDGVFEIQDAPPGGFVYTAPTNTVTYSAATPPNSYTADLMIEQIDGPDATQGFSVGLAHDPAYFTATSVDAAGPVADLDGGGGPAFWGIGLLADGITLGAVYDFLSTETITFTAPTHALSVSYDVSGLPTDPDMTTNVNLTFTDTLGSPPVSNVVVVAGASQPVSYNQGVVTFESMGGPALALFNRGDCNQDGMQDLADGIYLLNYMHTGGETPACLAACDMDDDGDQEQDDAIISFTYLYLDGPAPAAPHDFGGDCGTDPDILVADCDFGACP